jgi:phosphoglycerate dehydrogenase-like enzyme
VPPFRLAVTGDFLDETGIPAYGDAGLGLLQADPLVRYHFLTDQAPRRGEPEYWQRFYSFEVKPDHIRDIDGLVVLRPHVKRSTFAAGAGDLVVIGRSGAGYDKIDVAACTDNDVALFTAPLALNHPTASAALLLLLALAKRLPAQERVTRAGRWDLQAQVMGGELQGRTLGIVGLGNSGRELVRLVTPFAMRVLAYSPSAEQGEAEALGVRLTFLEEVLRTADFVSLHCRLTEKTRQLLGATELALMKPTAYLVNVARGALVDQAALVEALRRRQIAGAGLDVFEVEPLPPGDPLLQLDNVIVTPHWLASTRDVWDATGRQMAAGMRRAARGLVPENVVNPEVLSRPGFQAKLARFVDLTTEAQRHRENPLGP